MTANMLRRLCSLLLIISFALPLASFAEGREKRKATRRMSTRAPKARGKPVDKANKAKAAPVAEVALPSWDELSEIGRGTAVVFTPDMARAGNRRFYKNLGFLYIETPDWHEAISKIVEANRNGRAIHTVIMETHGNRGHGLKLQTGKDELDSRSYISLGALQELLAGSGVKQCILTACNAGRLLRPKIYYTLDKRALLPANYGIINASEGFDARQSDVRLLRRRESQLEMTNTVRADELPVALARGLNLTNPGEQFVVSDLFLQYVLRDPKLQLTDVGYVNAISQASLRYTHSEKLIERFITALSRVAEVVTDTRE